MFDAPLAFESVQLGTHRPSLLGRDSVFGPNDLGRNGGHPATLGPVRPVAPVDGPQLAGRVLPDEYNGGGQGALLVCQLFSLDYFFGGSAGLNWKRSGSTVMLSLTGG